MFLSSLSGGMASKETEEYNDSGRWGLGGRGGPGGKGQEGSRQLCRLFGVFFTRDGGMWPRRFGIGRRAVLWFTMAESSTGGHPPCLRWNTWVSAGTPRRILSHQSGPQIFQAGYAWRHLVHQMSFVTATLRLFNES